MRLMKFKYLIFSLIALIGVFVAQASVNASVVFFIEQPKVPECLLDRNGE